MKLYQDVLELLSHAKEGGDVRLTQSVMEWVRRPPSNSVIFTQGAIEIALRHGVTTQPSVVRSRMFYRKPFFPPR